MLLVTPWGLTKESSGPARDTPLATSSSREALEVPDRERKVTYTHLVKLDGSPSASSPGWLVRTREGVVLLRHRSARGRCGGSCGRERRRGAVRRWSCPVLGPVSLSYPGCPGRTPGTCPGLGHRSRCGILRGVHGYPSVFRMPPSYGAIAGCQNGGLLVALVISGANPEPEDFSHLNACSKLRPLESDISC